MTWMKGMLLLCSTGGWTVLTTVAAVPTPLLAAAASALLDERRLLSPAELADLAALPPASLPALAALAHEVRLAWCGPTVEIEGIVSAKTGGCPEDCGICSQSARISSLVRAAPLLDLDGLLAAAQETAALGASEFCSVVALRGPDERTLARVIEAVPLIRARTGLEVAASLGILPAEQARRLAAAGLHRYNHNL